MVELDEEAAVLLGLYLKLHRQREPVQGGGTIQLAFQLQPGLRAPALEPLLHVVGEHAWLIRWPNGTIRWVTEAHLVARGFAVPTHAIIADVGVDGTVTPYWEPPFVPDA